MGTIADSLFNVLMSWVRALVNALWALFSADGTTVLEFLGKNWLMVALVIIASGLVIDWIIWLLRWQPYHLWAQRVRRLLGMEEPEDERRAPVKAHAAVMPEKRYMRPREEREPEEEAPLVPYGEEDAQDVYEQAEDVSDDELGVYPGRRYDEFVYEAEQARLAKEAYEAEQARLAKEAYEAEQARLAREAYEAEQARLAQEEYARQMAEYERQKAQYERDLAEYERQKAAYEAQLAAQETQAAASAGVSRRRRMTGQACEPVGKTPVEAADMTQVIRPVKAAGMARKAAQPQKKQENREAGREEKKDDRGSKLLGRVAKMIEPEEEELIVRKTLPPRVDMNDAFRTAKLPVINPKRTERRRK